MLEHRYLHRVRYRECDPMGVVYHSHYLDWFEAARTEALRSLGLPYRELEEAGIFMPVVEVGLRYVRPARYDDEVEIRTMLGEEPPRIRLDLGYEVHHVERQELLVTGSVTLCFVDRSLGRPVMAPPRIADVFDRALKARSGAGE